MSAIPIYVDSNLVCVMPDGSTEEMARDEIKRLKIIHGVDRVYTIGARNTGRGVMMALDGDAQTIATLRADLARVTTAQTHTGVTADSRETICGLPRAPAFLEVPASDGVTCIACLQGVGRLYGENAFRNLNDAIANRERAERAEADLARVTGELDGLADGLTIANNAAERRGRERDAACAQVRELQRVARAADVLSHALEDEDVSARVGIPAGHLAGILDALPPSMLEEVSDG